MDWWQAGSTMATSVLAGLGVVRLVWRMMHDEFGKVRQESSEAHDTIGARITRLGDAQDAALRQVHDSLAADIAQLRQGQTSLREGLGEVRGELRGVTQSVQTLREDFRAHVLGGAG